MFFVYLLKSKNDNQFYIGSTNNLKKRLKEHNDGKSFFTKIYKPWDLIYFEAYREEKLARMREKRLKHHGNAIKELKKRVGLSSTIPAPKIMRGGAGVTIVEISVGVALIGLVVLLIATVYFAHFRLFTNQVTGIDVASQNKLALDEITNQVREAQAVETCPNPPCNPTVSPSADVLVLKLWAQDASGEPNSSNFDYIIYRQDQTKITKQIIANTTLPSSRKSGTKIISPYICNESSNCTNGKGLQFSYDIAPPNTTQVTATVITTAKYGDKTQTVNQSSKAVLRNK